MQVMLAGQRVPDLMSSQGKTPKLAVRLVCTYTFIPYLLPRSLGRHDYNRD